MDTIRSGARSLGYPDLDSQILRAADGLDQLGVGRGDSVGLLLRNDFSFFVVSGAAALLGAYPVPFNWHVTADEADYLLADSGAKALIGHADLIAGVRTVITGRLPLICVPTPPEIREAYGLAAAAPPPLEGAVDWGAWLAGRSPTPRPARDPAGAMIYTSGTTGRPKGVRRDPPTPEQARALDALRRAIFHLDEPEVRTVITGPMYHSAPFGYAQSVVRRRATIILQPRFAAEALLQTIERERITHLHMVPIMFNRLLKLPDAVRTRYDLSSLRHVVHAAAPVSIDVKRRMIEWWGPIIDEYYGGTETGAAFFCSSEEWLSHPGTVGRPVEGARVRILDADSNPLPAGRTGEIALRILTHADFTYPGDPAKRQAVARGELVTLGDVGWLDDDGYLYLCDRSIDMIISGGVNIYPAEIEAVLHSIAGVQDCAVFGIPDDDFGESVFAVIQPTPHAGLREEDILTRLRGALSGYKVPKRIVFQDELPREDSGKIMKRHLREPYWQGRDRRI